MLSLLSALILPAAFLLDWWVGEPKRGHPLVLFGRWAQLIERKTYRPLRMRGLIAWCMAVLPLVLALAGLHQLLLQSAWPLAWLFELWVVFSAIGHRSLHDHARAVLQALHQDDDAAARRSAARLVSRDEEALDPLNATVESLLENGNDAVFGAVFWYALGGLPGIVLYRLANTLDAMWGYRTPRWQAFGSAAARIDDALNWMPARLTALSYVLLGDTRRAWQCWREQAPLMQSPNAGPVMAAGAGALNVRLGGPARYQGQWKERPILGCGDEPGLDDVEASLRLLRHTSALWLLVILVLECLSA